MSPVIGPEECFPPPLLSRRELIAIGNIVVEWAYLETKIDESIWLLLGKPETVKFNDYLKICFNRRMKLWKELGAATLKDRVATGQLHSIIDRARDFRGLRDLIVHGRWNTNIAKSAPQGVVTWKFTPEWKATFHPISTAKMENFAKQLRELTDKIFEFERQHVLDAIPLPDIPG